MQKKKKITQTLGEVELIYKDDSFGSLGEFIPNNNIIQVGTLIESLENENDFAIVLEEPLQVIPRRRRRWAEEQKLHIVHFMGTHKGLCPGSFDINLVYDLEQKYYRIIWQPSKKNNNKRKK